jgi:hypothetical protein
VSASPPPIGLDDARRRLRELGYLEGGVERYLFARAFEGRGGLLVPAAILGAVAAAVASLAAVDAGEPGFGSSLLSVVALFAHLLLANLVPVTILAALAAFWADRSRHATGVATALGLACAALVFLLWIGGVWSLAREVSPRVLLWGVPVAIAALLTARSARIGFLAQAYAHSRVLPERPRPRVFLAAAVVGFLAAIAIFASRKEAQPAPPPRPSPRTGAVVVIGIDGLALDPEPAEGMAGIHALLNRGRTGWWPAQGGSPPEIWTDLATGVPASRHGVRALERVRPRGCPSTLRPPLGTSWYLRGVGPRLRLVSTAPVSARDRKSLAFWEVAASAGLPTLAVGWWASGPWPGSVIVSNEEILSRASDGLAADRDAIAAFRRDRADGQAIQTVYLPGPDILRGDRSERAAAARALEHLLEGEIARAATGPGALVVLAAESHPTPGSLGRMIVFDGDVSRSEIQIRPEEVAPSILARAGIPVAEDVSGHPVAPLFASGKLESATVPTYGQRIASLPSTSKVTDREYLERLKSLGYLN